VQESLPKHSAEILILVAFLNHLFLTRFKV
jgi:hypothetical protein